VSAFATQEARRTRREQQSLKRLDWLNGTAAALAIALAVVAAAAPTAADREGRPQRWTQTSSQRREALGSGGFGLRDAGGVMVELRDFRRIASGSLVADGLLDALCERKRIVAFSAYAREQSPIAFRFADRPNLPFDIDVEKLLAHKLDLLVLNGVSDNAKIDQLRSAGVTVFNLGEMRGLSTLLEQTRSLGELLGVPERAERFARTFEHRMHTVAARSPAAARRRAIYVGLHGDQLFGGGRHTSYDDVITHAGLINAAAEHHEGWPRYTAEQVIELDPDIVITQSGTADHLCEVFGLSRIRACSAGGQVVALPAGLLVNPGLAMLDTTEAVYRAVHEATP
jgi:iron complex transport system substrate-binding protein